MLKVIEHITKAIILAVVAVVCFSCGFDNKSVNGDGNVSTQNRTITGNFDNVSASGNIDVIVQQGPQQSVIVEADKNIQEHIKTELKDGELKITSDVNIRNASKKKITVTLPNVQRISAAIGASVINKGILKTDSLTLESDTGSNLKASIHTRNAKCETASGGFIEVLGVSEGVEANASSGSTLNAEKLKVVNARAHASSGASVTVNPTANLSADASSGGKVFYIKAPSQITKKASGGGDVSLKQ